MSLLSLTLALAVPLEIDRLRTADDDTRALQIETILSRNSYPTSMVAARGDDLMYGGSAAGADFAELARVLACLAWAPGGVTVDGIHYCARHDLCLNAAAEMGAA